MEKSSAELRIALVDACQSGALGRPKGFGLGPKIDQSTNRSTGTALLLSADSSEAAQESLELGGSYFTHFLVSALRGAGDSDGDKMVTLAEAHSHATSHTQRATSAWARSIQRPTYEFDIAGHGNIVLTDLREGSARLELTNEMQGHVVITERESPVVLLEATKRPSTPLSLALPTGRYLVHLRQPTAVYLAEVTLPWGGTIRLDTDDMTPRSYQAVAQKGGVLEVNRHRLRVGGGVRTPAVAKMGALPFATLAYGYDAGLLEFGVRLTGLRKTFDAVDTEIQTSILGVGVSLGSGVGFSAGGLRCLGSGGRPDVAPRSGSAGASSELCPWGRARGWSSNTVGLAVVRSGLSGRLVLFSQGGERRRLRQANRLRRPIRRRDVLNGTLGSLERSLPPLVEYQKAVP